jgi:hypothetical protein
MLGDQRSGSDRRLLEKANQRLKGYRRRRWGEISKHQGDRSIKEGVVRSLADPGCKLDRRGPVLDVTTLKKTLGRPRAWQGA